MSARLRQASASIAIAIAVAFATPAAGQGGDKAMAESLFQAGRALMKEGKVNEACPKFAESQRIDPSAGTLLNLGKCLEAQGKTASAWAAYKEAIVLGRSSGQSKQVTAGTQFAGEVEPKLSKLRIDAPGDIAGLTVKRDGAVIGSAAFGVPIAVDPGEHTIEASAPGKTTWRTTVTLGASADHKTVTIPALEVSTEPAPSAESSAQPAAPPPATSATEAPPPPPPPQGSGLRTLGFVTVGIGVAAIGAGTVLGVMTLGDASDAEKDPKLCPDKRCTPAGVDKIDGAKTKALISTIGLGVGVAAVGAGIAMIVVSGKQAPAASSGRARLIPTAGREGAGLQLVGAF